MTIEPPRGIRAERQAQTRERLVDVARRLLLEDGYAATSLDKVAAAAGFSKGAVYSNFSGKDELCLEVLDSIHEEQIEGLLEVFTTDTDLSGRIEAFIEWARTGLGRSRWAALEVEFAAVARRSPFVAEELLKRHRELVRAAADLIRSVAEEEGLELLSPAHESATALLSLGIGMGALRSLDPEIDVAVFATAIRSMIRTAPVA